jgi:hypothetical protein
MHLSSRIRTDTGCTYIRSIQGAIASWAEKGPMDPLVAVEHGQVLEPPSEVSLDRTRKGGLGSLGGTSVEDPARKSTSAQNCLGDEDQLTSQCVKCGSQYPFSVKDVFDI